MVDGNGQQEAVAVIDGNVNSAHVVSGSRRARTKGIHAGLSMAQALAILPKLIENPNLFYAVAIAVSRMSARVV